MKLLLLLLLLLRPGAGGAQSCPPPCSCSGPSVDCHGLALRSVPRNLPRHAERL